MEAGFSHVQRPFRIGKLSRNVPAGVTRRVAVKRLEALAAAYPEKQRLTGVADLSTPPVCPPA